MIPSPIKVSIIINNFNYSKYVVQCLKSAVDQSYQNIEIIIVDDGSSDGSVDQIQSFIEGSSRAIFSDYKSNGGQASALNRGFEMSSGDLVLFLDADDAIDKNCIEKVLASWREEMSKLHFAQRIIDGDGLGVNNQVWMQSLPQGDLREEVLRTGTTSSAPTSANVFSRSFLKDVMPIPEDEWRLNADVYLFNLAALAGEIGAIDQVLGSYRVHGKNGSAHTNGNKCVEPAMARDIDREILTDDLLADYARRKGFVYTPNALTNSTAHKQLLFIYRKVFGGKCTSRSKEDSTLPGLLINIFSQKWLEWHKKFAISSWLLLIGVLPNTLRETVVVWGYRNGFVISKSKFVEKN